MEKLINYLESYPQLVSLIIFFSSLLVGWLTGAFKAIKGIAQKLDNKLRIKINPATARLTFLKEFEHDKKQEKRFAFWLSLKISNPSEKVLSVSEFYLKFQNKKMHWSKALIPVTFPNLPRVEIGDNIKFLPVFFSHFSEWEKLFGHNFTPDGKIDPGDYQSGYLLFCEHFFGNWLPLITERGVRIKIICKDLKGKKYITKGWARSISREEAYKFIPGLRKYEEGEQFLSLLSRWEKNIDLRSEEGKELINKVKKIEK